MGDSNSFNIFQHFHYRKNSFLLSETALAGSQEVNWLGNSSLTGADANPRQQGQWPHPHPQVALALLSPHRLAPPSSFHSVPSKGHSLSVDQPHCFFRFSATGCVIEFYPLHCLDFHTCGGSVTHLPLSVCQNAPEFSCAAMSNIYLFVFKMSLRIQYPSFLP